MKVSDVMAGITVDPSYDGTVMVDDMVLAIDPTPNAATATAIADYIVAQGNVSTQEGNISTNTQTSTYVREGESIDVSSVGRSFAVTGDRKALNEFQDYCFNVTNMYSTGGKKETNYVWFNMVNGVGEQGRVSIAVNSDGGGTAGEKSSFDVTLNKVGANPTAYTYAP